MGPGCLTAVFGMGTGVAIRVWSPGKSQRCIKKVAVRVALPESLGPARAGAGKEINAVKRLAVSTGRLSVLPRVHPRPIDLVVFQEPSPPKGQETSSHGGFHA